MADQRTTRPPARHPRTGAPAARIERGTVYWYGLRVASLTHEATGRLRVRPVSDPEWPARNKASVLKSYGTCAVLTGCDDGVTVPIYHLGDEIGRATRYPGGCIFRGRWFKTPEQAAAVLRMHGKPWPDPEIRLDPAEDHVSLDVRLRGDAVGRVNIQANGEVILRHAGRADTFHSVPSLIRWLSNRFAARNPVDDDAAVADG